MTGVSVYLLDANVFIQAARRYYAFDIAPRFWDALITEAANGRVRSIDRVKDELDKGKDDLTNWANGHFLQWFDSTDAGNVIEAYERIMVWSSQQDHFTETARAELANSTDAWVVAYAIAERCVIVTEEKFDPKVRRKIPIPNVCRAFNVDYMDTFQLLRTLGVRLG